MSVSVVLPVVMSAFVIATCQQPLDHLREISPYIPPPSLERNPLRQCEAYAQDLTEENEELRYEIRRLRAKMEELEEEIEAKQYEREEEEEEGEEGDEGEEGEVDYYDPENDPLLTRYRRKRAAGCEGGTLAAWACAPQCVFKLKGLCGLSLKSICHC